ncbi:MAG: hypothetical protein AAF961_19290, partial [Planctomycetota bacterium]
MQALITSLAMALATQVSAGDRYGPAAPPTPAGPDDSARQAFADAPQPDAAASARAPGSEADATRSILTERPTPAVEGYPGLRDPRSVDSGATLESNPPPIAERQQVAPRVDQSSMVDGSVLKPTELTKTLLKAPAGIPISGI